VPRHEVLLLTEIKNMRDSRKIRTELIRAEEGGFHPDHKRAARFGFEPVV
jgi:hypothetical protein